MESSVSPTPRLSRPLFVIYIAWHPDYKEGDKIAKGLYEHYRRKLYDNVAGGSGLGVFYRFTPEASSSVPRDIDFADAEASVVILLIDQNWVDDPDWVNWGNNLIERAEEVGLNTRVFPISIDGAAMHLGMADQAIRWDQWNNLLLDARMRRLIPALTYQFVRMLRLYLEGLRQPMVDEDALDHYLRKVEIFLSHSKHDEDGERIAQLIRKRLQDDGDLESFFDVFNIPAGTRFDKVILHKVGTSAVVSIHTDSYSSREWCRREIIEAKRKNAPLVVANCLSNLDERSFPYMGNVPVIRMDPATAEARIDYVISRLLDEVMKDFLWRCRIELTPQTGVYFLPRPPELISLVEAAETGASVVVYPDPPVGAEEKALFEKIAPLVQLKCITEWSAEEGI